MVLLIHAFLPDGAGRDVLYVGVGAAATAAAARATSRMSGPARSGWVLLTLGLAAWVLGDLTWVVLDRVLGYGPFPSVADVAYLASYPLLATGLVRAFPAPRGRRSAWLLDSLLMVGGVLLALWLLVLSPALAGWWTDPGGSVVGALYPVGDALLLVALVRPFAATGGRPGAYRLAGLSVLAILVADVLFQVAQTRPALEEHLYLLDSLWLIGYVLLARAAWHPSTAQCTPPCPADELPAVHIALIAASASVVPVTLVVSGLNGGDVPLVEVCSIGTLMLTAILIRFGGVVRDLHEKNARLARLAVTDPLTGLANAAGLADHVERGPDQRSAATLPAVLLIALDGYQDVAETLGHTTADDMVRAVGRRLEATAGPGGLAARTGRDVFALAVEVDSPAHADEVARVTLQRLGLSVEVRGMDLMPGATIGIAVAGARPAELADLVARADLALSVARGRPERIARDCSDADGPPGATVPGGDLLRGLVAGVERGELVVHFQPVTTVSDGRVCAAEALVRWQHPEHGLLGPAAFVPAAERTGLIRPVTRFVLDTALAQCARWRALVPDFTVAVNISAHDVDDSRLVDDIRAALVRHGLPSSALELEVTETMAMRDLPRAEQTLRTLSELGVGLAVDDYGVGYGSLDYLRRLPFTVLKVDRAFVAPATDDPVCAAILRSTVDLGHALGMHVVAEGVEDAATFDLLRELDCDSAQGWQLGRPAPAAALDGLLAAQVPVG